VRSCVVPDGSYNVDFKIYNTLPYSWHVGIVLAHVYGRNLCYGGYAGGTASIGPQVTVKKWLCQA